MKSNGEKLVTVHLPLRDVKITTSFLISDMEAPRYSTSENEKWAEALYLSYSCVTAAKHLVKPPCNIDAMIRKVSLADHCLSGSR